MAKNLQTATSMKSRQAGFSFVEMGVALVVIGFVLSGLMLAGKVYFKDRQITITEKNTALVTQAITNFVLEEGRFPCPAAIDLAPENPAYGREADCTALRGYDAMGAIAGAVAPGGFSGGIWVEEGEIDDTARVVRGMVPFQSLNLPEFYVNDGYGSRILYAVTASQANANTFSKDAGAVSVKSVAGAGTETTHFVVFSAGPDRKGAYSRLGRAVFACGTVAANGLDSENCNTDAGNKAAIYHAVGHSISGTATHFDDHFVLAKASFMPLWRMDDVGSANIRTINHASKVAMGTATVAATAAAPVQVAVGGTLRATQRAMGAGFCDPVSGKCFTTNLIAGSEPVMNCGVGGASSTTGTIMTGIGDNEAKCTPEPTDPSSTFTCPQGTDYYIAGFEPDGTPICSRYEYVVPPPPTPGPECRPVSETRQAPCPAGYEGEQVEQRNLECPLAVWTAWSVIDSSACAPQCIVTSEEQNVPCPAGQAGTIVQRRTYQCPAQTWSPWATVGDNCATSCDTTAYEDQMVPCGTGQTGSKNQRRTLQCPAFTWSAWTDHDLGTNTCLAIVNGACGPSHGNSFASAPSTGLCTAGTPTTVNTSGSSYTWQCQGENTGTTASCSATQTTPTGECRNYAGSVFDTQPAVDDATACWPAAAGGTYTDTADLPGFFRWQCTFAGPPGTTGCVAEKKPTCIEYGSTYGAQPATDTPTGCSIGSYGDVSDTATEWKWVCKRANGTVDAQCSALKTLAPVDGVCGSAHGGTPTATPPTSNLCSVGAASPVADYGDKWLWECAGSNGGITRNCLVQKPAAPACTWQSVGPYATSADTPMAIFDMNCGAVEPAACGGCTSFPAVNNCTPGGSCSTTMPCLNNQSTCEMGPSQTAYVWDRYECDCGSPPPPPPPTGCTGNISWSMGGGPTCMTEVSLTEGQSTTVSANTAYWSTGDAVVKCESDTLQVVNSISCSRIDRPCAAQTVSWGPGCQAAVSALNEDDSVPITNTAAGFVGWGHAHCVAGIMSVNYAQCDPE